MGVEYDDLSGESASTLVNRFLSLLCWCDDSHAILREGWSGNPVPSPVPRRNLAFATAYQWFFDRSIPRDDDLLQRLAYYREGLNAKEASIASFEVLSFFKVFEIRHKGKPGEKNPTKLWIAKVFDEASRSVRPEVVQQFHAERGSKSVERYIYDNYRVATAHTSKDYPSDADSSPEVRRLFIGAEVMRALARHFIRTEFALSEIIMAD